MHTQRVEVLCSMLRPWPMAERAWQSVRARRPCAARPSGRRGGSGGRARALSRALLCSARGGGGVQLSLMAVQSEVSPKGRAAGRRPARPRLGALARAGRAPKGVRAGEAAGCRARWLQPALARPASGRPSQARGARPRCSPVVTPQAARRRRAAAAGRPLRGRLVAGWPGVGRIANAQRISGVAEGATCGGCGARALGPTRARGGGRLGAVAGATL